MPTSPKSRRKRRLQVLAGACAGAVLITGFAVSSHADEAPITVIPLIAPTTSVVVPATPAPTVAPPTTEAPLPTLPPATAAATTTPPTTLPATTVPSTEPPLTSTTTSTKPTPTRPKANPNATGPVSIEIDISSQTLFLRKGGTLVRTLHVSTGSGRRFCNSGKCQTAHTPRGRFRIQRRIGGWRTGALGRMFSPMYFSGGYAIHGSGSVPNRPASHGCVRITIGSASWLVRQVPNGTPVWIHN